MADAVAPKGPRWRRVARWVATRIIIFYLLWGVFLFSLQRFLLYPGRAIGAPADSPTVSHLERLFVESSEGRVEGWFIPGAGAAPESPRPLVIFAHGNGELIDDWPIALRPYRAMGVSLLLAEYRGYGRSAGSPSQRAITEDFIAFRDQVAARPDVDAARIVYHGRSLGGGAVCALAAVRPPRALILQSTFTSIRSMARRYLLPGFLVLDPFDNDRVLATLDVPVFIAHGRSDDMIPPSHAEALAAAARRSTLVWYDCKHNDFPPDWDAFFGDVEAFLRGAGVL